MRGRRCLRVAAATLWIVACGGKSSAELIAEHDRSRVSWEQTARFVGECWLAKEVPTAYARHTLQVTLDELAKEDHAIASNPLPAEARLHLRRALASTREFARMLAVAVAADDRSTAALAIGLSKHDRAGSAADSASHQ
jgi:hypothetical protein